jgi:hypothetical protein
MSGCGKRSTCGPMSAEASRDVENTRSSPDCTQDMEMFADHDESGSCEVKVRSGGASGGSKRGRSLFLLRARASLPEQRRESLGSQKVVTRFNRVDSCC